MSSHRPTYAVGDIHGAYDLFTQLLADIHRDADARGGGARIVFVGDYIDRGPDSKGVLDALIAGPTRAGEEWICLSGNHEELMVQAPTSETSAAHWMRQGGDTTLASFGGPIPDDVLAWCEALPACFDDGQRFFVHAGIRPGVPLERQTRRDMLRIRNEFHVSTADHGRLIVHGHTPDANGPIVLPNRINLDTGVYFTGVLTAAAFDNASVRFLQARRT